MSKREAGRGGLDVQRSGGAEADAGRRDAAKVLAGMAALGLGLGVTRTAAAGELPVTFFVDGKEVARAPLPEEVARALLDRADVSGEVRADRWVWRFNFKIEIEG